MKTKPTTQKTNGAANGEKRAEPPVPAGFRRVPVYPAFWDPSEAGDELHGAIVDVSSTSNAAGTAISALVIVTDEPAKGRTRFGDRVELAAREPVYVDAPELLRYAPIATDAQHVIRCVVHYFHGRYWLDLAEQPSPRGDYAPRTILNPPAAPAAS